MSIIFLQTCTSFLLFISPSLSSVRVSNSELPLGHIFGVKSAEIFSFIS